jgi:hypothetical protein
MQKWLVAAGAFVVGAALGMGVLAVSIVVFGLVTLRHSQVGIGAYAGGIGHWTVLVVPVACGALLAGLAIRRLNRIEEAHRSRR